MLDEHGVVATCFFLGYVGERFPHLVKRAASAGHEIASHGYHHRLVFSQTAAEFRDDARRTRELLEDIAGAPVLGYRAASFSVDSRTPWFFEELASAGYRYDSSIFPAPHRVGGAKDARLDPYRVETANGPIVEIPITAVKLFGKPMCFFGGGYLRLTPYRLVRAMAGRAHADGRPVVFYVHPREIDSSQPRIRMGAVDSFKSYVNIDSTERKIRNIFRDFRLTTFNTYLEDNRWLRSA
jgi:polysaccharide deacetylase family protein (PEP-CTERM system associated)